MGVPDRTEAARADWDQRIGRRTGPGQNGDGGLPPPDRVRAVAGQGHVTLDWDPVPGAAGYLVYRAAGQPYQVLDHGGGDVLAVPAGPYADTSGEPGRIRHYAVAAVTDGTSAGPLSEPVASAPAAANGGRPVVTVEVGEPGGGQLAPGGLGRPWEPMIGSEHLSYLLSQERTGGRVIGPEVREALRIAHDELGVQAVRAHAILCDDLGVYTEADGSGVLGTRAVHDFSGIDRVYDQLMELGLRPVVELSFMPRDLARDPGQTVFSYGAIISPPRDWDRWADLVRVDFLSTHVYGNVPLDLRPVLASFGRAGAPIWWTEWGTTPTHFHHVGDTVFAAAFLLRGMASALGRIEALSHWVASDHFEELGRAPELFHGGFGLLSVGNLRKPRYWAMAMLARLGRSRLAADVRGDGAGGLVEALAARHDDGRTGIAVWNVTLDQSKIAGDPLLDRVIRVRVAAPPGVSFTVRHYRIDEGHSNIVPVWERMRGGAPWPDDGQWAALRERNTLDELGPPWSAAAGADGVLELAFELPMPGVSYLELDPWSPWTR